MQHHTPPQDKLVDVSAFDQFGLRREELYKMAAKGLIPHYRVGAKRGGIRFVVAEVLEALKVKQ